MDANELVRRTLAALFPNKSDQLQPPADCQNYVAWFLEHGQEHPNHKRVMELFNLARARRNSGEWTPYAIEITPWSIQ